LLPQGVCELLVQAHVVQHLLNAATKSAPTTGGWRRLLSGRGPLIWRRLLLLSSVEDSTKKSVKISSTPDTTTRSPSAACSEEW
jgi:hypothetical protein